MAVFLFILCGLSFVSGVLTSLQATTIFQQIFGAVSYVAASILLAGAATVNAVDKLRNSIQKGT